MGDASLFASSAVCEAYEPDVFQLAREQKRGVSDMDTPLLSFTPPLVGDLGRCYLPAFAVHHYNIEPLRQVDDRFSGLHLLLSVELTGEGVYI